MSSEIFIWILIMFKITVDGSYLNLKLYLNFQIMKASLGYEKSVCADFQDESKVVKIRFYFS